MVKRCLLVLVLAATHSPVASGAGAPGVPMHGVVAPGAATPGVAAPGGATRGGATRGTKSNSAADKYQTWRAEAAATLTARADANSLATAAALRYAGPAYGAKMVGAKAGPSALGLAARASELAPQNASIAWLQTLAAAQKDRDVTEVDRILADMAHGERFDFYWNRIVVLMVDALDAAH